MKKGKDHVHEEIGRAFCGCFWIGGKPGNRLRRRRQHRGTGALAFDRLRRFNRCGGRFGGPGQEEKEINKNAGTAVELSLYFYKRNDPKKGTLPFMAVSLFNENSLCSFSTVFIQHVYNIIAFTE